MRKSDPPVCAQCGRTGWSITVGGVPAAPLTLEEIGSLQAKTYHFCDTLCLLRWAVDQREQVTQFWIDSWSRSASDTNHILRASMMERVMIHRWWRSRVEHHHPKSKEAKDA
jgi:hypothetical protein